LFVICRWFIAKHGEQNSVEFHKARDAFTESLAAYSVILYLLQIKDRHNGNVLIDENGHIIHIDFGFIFDIAPGGIKFELSPFKLTKEMMMIMGPIEGKPYKRFVALCVKAFLSCRPFAEEIIRVVQLMLDSELRCFREQTIARLRDRFKLNFSEKDAANYMIGLVGSSRLALSTKVYDTFQRLQNGIPF
jgi:phosphatidylinositol 4-kinase